MTKWLCIVAYSRIEGMNPVLDLKRCIIESDTTPTDIEAHTGVVAMAKHRGYDPPRLGHFTRYTTYTEMVIDSMFEAGDLRKK